MSCIFVEPLSIQIHFFPFNDSKAGVLLNKTPKKYDNPHFKFNMFQFFLKVVKYLPFYEKPQKTDFQLVRVTDLGIHTQ